MMSHLPSNKMGLSREFTLTESCRGVNDSTLDLDFDKKNLEDRLFSDF
jgi:hypothetical protein